MVRRNIFIEMKLEEKLKLAVEKGYTYDPETGIIKSKLGKICNSSSSGYIQVGGNDCRVLGHQLAWYLYYNKVPKIIDHKDRVRSNNKIDNLRETTHHENLFNTNAKGYSYVKSTNKYLSSIRINNKHIYLGHYNTPEEAHQAYLDAKKIYHKIKNK